MSFKPKFRSRKLDYKKPLALVEADGIADIDDEAYRAIPVVSTGVEKEEEEEHHLQAVISAGKANDSKAKASAYIPTPKATTKFAKAKDFYKRDFKMPKSLIRFSSTVEDCIGVPYCMDSRDTEWLKKYNSSANMPLKESQFELLINEMEKIASQKVSIKDPKNTPDVKAEDLEAFILIHSDEIVKNSLSPVLEYWKSRRSETGSEPLTPILKFEEAYKGEADPFICFRRREVRTTRRTRRTDAQSLRKLRQLKSELESAKTLFEMLARREKMRRDSISLDRKIFEQKSLVRKVKEQLGLPEEVIEEARAAQRRAARLRESSSPSKRIKPSSKKRPLAEIDSGKDPLEIALDREISKCRKQDPELMRWLESSPGNAFSHPASDYYVNDIYLDQGKTCIDRGRVRIGRGGRIIIDRQVEPRDKNIFDDFENIGPQTSSNIIMAEEPSDLSILEFRLNLLKKKINQASMS